jgi:Response regulators consisting of a CheY-like receiver domain and a winged-helix DNA-binding domain
MKYKVLLADDNSEFRLLIKIFLSKDFIVEAAENGLEALDIIEKGFQPDIIISDLMMPDIDGLTMISQIKRNKKCSNVPVIMLSTIDRNALGIDLSKIGLDDFILKPFYPKDLITKMEKLLHKVAC